MCHLHSLQLFRKLQQEKKNVSLTLVIEILINIRKSVKMTLFQQKNHVIKQIDTNSQITQIVNHFTENSCLLDITIQTDEPEKKLRFRTSAKQVTVIIFVSYCPKIVRHFCHLIS